LIKDLAGPILWPRGMSDAPASHMNSRTLLSLVTGCLFVSVVVACSSPTDTGKSNQDLSSGDQGDGTGSAPKSPQTKAPSGAPSAAPSNNGGTPDAGPNNADGGTSTGQCVPDPEAPAKSSSFDPKDESNDDPTSTEDAPPSACLACCDAANPAAVQIETTWSTCIEACTTQACLDACDTAEETACKGSNGACDKMDACLEICDPPTVSLPTQAGQ
jgi:hypothetical protein